VTVTVSTGSTGGNNSPIAVDDTATTPKDTATSINVTGNDYDPDNNLDTVITIVTQPSNGTAAGSSG